MTAEQRNPATLAAKRDRVHVYVYNGTAKTLRKLMRIRRQKKHEVIRDALALLDAHHHDLRLAKSRAQQEPTDG